MRTTVGGVTGAFLHPFARPTRESFISLTRGDGSVVWDADGNEYIDAMASLWYCAIGHGRQEMADVISKQVSTLAAYSCFDPFTNEPADALAERLVSLTPIPDARVFFCQSGSEAVDTAMKLARLAHVLAGNPQRTLIISRMRGYHGTNFGGTTAQGLPPNKEGWGPLVPEVVQVPGDDVEALAQLMAERSNEVAAVLTEPIQGAGGVWPPDEGYLESARRLCDQHGAFLIFDEVITGYGRLGTWFAADHFDVTPDVTTFAKAVTSGYQPLGGVFVGSRVRESLESDPAYVLKTGYTYSGHPTACAAGLENLAIIEREGLLGEAKRIGARLADGLRSLAADGVIAGARGDVAVWAAAMHDEQNAIALRDRMLELGVITRAIADHSLTFCPPLVTTDAQIDRIVDALATAASE
jgi:adenosylmethionine-8-amino-7-oxononanoate aminotransferase